MGYEQVSELRRIAHRYGPGFTSAFGPSKKKTQTSAAISGGRIISPCTAERLLAKLSK